MRASSRPLAVVLAMSVLAGCAVGPDYQKPSIALTGHYLGQAELDRRQAPAVASQSDWWNGFDDPLLARLVTQALAQNLDIAQAGARLAQSRAGLREAGAALLPSGNLSVQAAQARQSLDTPLGQLLNAVPDFQRNSGYYEADAGASWELDAFGGLRRGREAAHADYQASQAGVAASRLAIAAQTADTYVAIRGLQARLAIANQQVETSRRLLATIRLQYEKGIAAELQVRQAEGALAQVEAGVPVLEAGLDSALNALDVLLGTQPGSHRAELSAAAPIPAAPGIADSGTPADLIRRRPDLIVAERKLAASNARIGMAVAEYYPSFSLGATLGTASTATGDLFSHGATQAQAVLGLRWRLFDFGRVDAEIAAAHGRNAEALAAYRLAVLRASEEVEDAFSDLLKRESEARTLASGEVSLARARETSFLAYKGGVVSLIEVLDADRDLLQVRDAKAMAQTEATRAAIASFRALGGGWDIRQIAPAVAMATP